MHDIQRFIDRIGKRIYRDETTCPCKDCNIVAKEWIIVHNKEHAMYLNMVSWDYPIEYRDTP